MRSVYALRISLEVSMQFGSVCSGIEAASVALNPLGMHAAWLAEIDAFPSAVLAHHYPDTPNIGDMALLPDLIRTGSVTAPEMLCGGTPCQAFSMAGNRQSLDDDRGNLSLIFCEIANAIDDVRRGRGEKPAIILWENVPGVLSTHDNAFGSFLAGLAGESKPLITPRNKWPNAGIVVGPVRSIAWRILDSQYFGLAQRRKRVFLISSARDDIDIGQILFEFDAVQKHTRPIREIRKADSKTSERITDGQSSAGMTYSISGNGVHTGKIGNAPGFYEEISPAVTLKHHASIGGGNVPMVDIRRLTPRECERLQGFPDDYTLIPFKGKMATDAPRYKALGNSWPVPVVQWIGKRIMEILK